MSRTRQSHTALTQGICSDGDVSERERVNFEGGEPNSNLNQLQMENETCCTILGSNYLNRCQGGLLTPWGFGDPFEHRVSSTLEQQTHRGFSRTSESRSFDH